MEPDSGIPLLKKERSQQATQQMGWIHAWDKPHLNFVVSISTYYYSYKVIEALGIKSLSH